MKYIILNKKIILTTLCCIISITTITISSIIIFKNINNKKVINTISSQQVPIYNVQTDKKIISLGINCAWDDKDVDSWLNLLKNENIKATFFVVGDWCDKYPDSLKKIAENGHEIGNHSNTHPDMTKLSENDIKKEIDLASDKIEKITGIRPKLFRAPSGAYNNNVLKVAEKLGYKTIQWNIDSIDWKNISSTEIEKRIISKIDNGAITLFHQGKENSLQAMPNIIKTAKKQGFDFVPISEIIYQENYYINSSGKQIPN